MRLESPLLPGPSSGGRKGRSRLLQLSALAAAALFVVFVWRADTSDLRAAAASRLSLSSSRTAGGSSALALPVSYRVDTPPSVGCEDIVEDLRRRLIDTYSDWFHGIRAVNILGYLNTENKGDAAIWAAQQILLNILGIRTMQVCRYYTKGCDKEAWDGAMKQYSKESAVAIAGGGNFNDYYWDDQANRPAMVAAMHNYPIRSFPQSIWMTKPRSIKITVDSYGAHDNMQVGARDQRSQDWCMGNLDPVGVNCTLTPDIAFMFGSRPDIRRRTPKKFDILILSRQDAERTSEWPVPDGISAYRLADDLEVTVRKVDWNRIPMPRISTPKDRDAVAHTKAMQGFEILAEASLVITDRLHAHILSTMLGTPHILLDSKLGKNVAYHETWTKDCDCTRIAESAEQALDIARLFFRKELDEGRPLIADSAATVTAV